MKNPIKKALMATALCTTLAACGGGGGAGGAVGTVENWVNNDLSNSNKNIKINVNQTNLNGSKLHVLGVESKLEQIVANLLDNAVSFSPINSQISILCDVKKNEVQLVFEDEGPGFDERNINKIFSSF